MARNPLGRSGAIGGLGAALVVGMAVLAGCGGELGAVGGNSPLPPPGPEPFQERAVLRGEQETPPTGSTATGTALVTVSGDGTTLTVVANTQGLVNPTAAHIHIGAPQQPGPIILPLYSAATDGPLPATLTRTLTAANLTPQAAQGINTFAEAVTAIEQGQTFINFHTQEHTAGEIRGQIGPVTLHAALTGGQEIPPVLTDATGTATITLNALQTAASVTLTTQNITDGTADIHVGAVGQAGPEIFALFSSVTSGTFPGTITRVVSAADLQAQPTQGITTFDDAVSAMLAGRTYANIHTLANPNGEIRGQIGP